MDFDFNSLQANPDAVWFDVTDPNSGMVLTHSGAPVRLAILGPDTDHMIAIEDRIQDRRLETAGKTGQIKLKSAELRAELIDRAVASIVDWEQFFKDGKPLDHNETNVRALVSKNRWLLNFWEEKYRDQGNFLGTVESTQSE